MNADQEIGLGFLGLAAALFALGFWIRSRERAARRWPQARGVIVASKRIGGGKETTPVIEYEFEYQGRSFKSSHWRYGNYTYGDPESAEAAIARYPAGLPVTVFVNVREPEKSVLETGASLFWVPFGFGLFFLGIAILAILAAAQKR
jgi:hypothetical protein